MVGPASHGEQTQKFVHHAMGADQPQGWSHQLKNEAGINLSYERRWRNILEMSAFGLGVDAIPYGGVALGNVNTHAAFGTTFRFGYDLPADYGPPRIRPSLPGSDFFIPSQKLSGYLFSSFEIRAIERNIFLDGNTFQDSPHVHKRPFVGSMNLGGTMIFRDTRVSYTHIFMTKEFKGQQINTQFGALTVSYRF